MQQIKRLLDHFTPDGQQFSEDGFYEILERSTADYDWQKGVFRALDNLSKVDLNLCERGNTLLLDGDGGLIAWLTILGNTRLEVSYQPDNYPALAVNPIELTDEQLAEHINNKCQGWLVAKFNVDGLNNEGGMIADSQGE